MECEDRPQKEMTKLLVVRDGQEFGLEGEQKENRGG